MKNKEPFSFKEINSIKNFELLEPKFLKSSDNTLLAYYDFADQNSKKTIILYAGAGLYGNKTYQWVAKNLKEKYNINCYIFDKRGHGNSHGKRGHAPSINRIWIDVSEAIDFVKKENPNSKIYLAGHSAGAGLIINYLSNIQNKLEDGYIFLAPFFGPESNTIKKNNFIKKKRSWVFLLASIFPNSFLIHCKAVFFNYSKKVLRSNPLIVPFYTHTMACAMTPYNIEEQLKKINKPTAIFIGDKDEEFYPERILWYKDFINSQVEAKLISNVCHLSILLNTPELIASFINDK